MFYYYPPYVHPISLRKQQLYLYYDSLYAKNLIKPYYYQNKSLNLNKMNRTLFDPRYRRFYRDLGFEYFTDWFSDKYDRYKKYLFKCFYNYPYQFDKIKICMKEKYNVPNSIAEKITNIAQYGYETAGWADEKLLLNKLSGEWETNNGVLKLYVTEDLIPTNDAIFPYTNKVSGTYNWDGGGKIEGTVNWRGVLSGDYTQGDKSGKFEMQFVENNGKRTFEGRYTNNDKVYNWEGKQIKVY